MLLSTHATGALNEFNKTTDAVSFVHDVIALLEAQWIDGLSALAGKPSNLRAYIHR